MLQRFRRILKEATLTRNFLTTTTIEGTKVGLVSFSSEEKTRIISDLVLLDSDVTRHQLAEMVPTVTNGSSTCIGCGMEKAFDVIQRGNKTSESAKVILITDGKNTVAPDKIKTMKALFVEKRIKIDCVAFSEEADEVLQELSRDTGGRLFLQTDNPSSDGLHDVFTSTLAASGKTVERPLELFTQSFLLPANEVRTWGVFIDSTIGNRTTFEFIYYINKKKSPVEVVVTSPSGEKYKRSTAGYAEDLTFHIISIRIPGTAEPGLWTFDVTSRHPTDVELLVSVTSYPSQFGVEPIVAKAELSSSGIDLSGGDPLIAFAEIRQGFNPVINCRVIATIDGPNGTSVDIKLLDNGAGADITSRDGIYSRFVTKIADLGFYGIKIRVDNNNGTAMILNKNGAELPYSGAVAYVDPKELLSGGIPIIDGERLFLPGMPVPPLRGTPAPLFVRQTSAGSSRISLSDASTRVNLDAPPSKIHDLRVTSTSYEKEEVTITFNAPGDDLDNGAAHHYEILQSNTTLNRISDLWQVVDDDAVVKGNLRAPSAFGTLEEFVIRVTNPLNLDTISRYFAVLAYDNSSNVSPMSNVVLATLRRFIPLPPPPTMSNPPQNLSHLPEAIFSTKQSPSWFPPETSLQPSDGISSTELATSRSRNQTSPRATEVSDSTEPSIKEQLSKYLGVIIGGGGGIVFAIAVVVMVLIAYKLFQNTRLCKRRPKFLDEETADTEDRYNQKESHKLYSLPI
ncbi:Calcium-activated chloride channel regulator 4A [Holothuria leucospilota]|uniref:Calcium-activated chloride channel regulator 4A n=1 Tax=Holothuria leucospilota TaxID=206669 RepID=A0A9Q1BEZ0_HOLLE|nr:Calcium-activated chloride channel regulator 4A [Holothuria leucospilota]